MRTDHNVLRRKLRVATLACAAWMVTGGAVMAAEPVDDIIEVTIDFAKVLKLDQEPGLIILGNPGIADIKESREQPLVLIITGRAAGTTNLIVMDKEGNEFLNSKILVFSDIQKLTTIFYGRVRQTFSCAPVCEQVIAVGDDTERFESASAQIQLRQEFSRPIQ